MAYILYQSSAICVVLYGSYVCSSGSSAEPSGSFFNSGLGNFILKMVVSFARSALIHVARSLLCCNFDEGNAPSPPLPSPPVPSHIHDDVDAIRYEYVSLFHFRKINYCLKVNYVCVLRICVLCNGVCVCVCGSLLRRERESWRVCAMSIFVCFSFHFRFCE